MSFTQPAEFTTRPTLRGDFGMSASTHWLATAAAQSVLERGGNAFDAAVSGAFVLHLVEPHLNGPGGDMTGVFATAADPATPVVLMGQGPAPAAASIDHFLAEGLDLVPGAGALAAAVPGAVDAWLVLLRDHGSWPLAQVLESAIGIAERGHEIVPRVAHTISTVAELFQEHWPSSAALWMPEGQVPQPWDVLRNPEYAAVLKDLIAAEASILKESGSREAAIDAARTHWRTGPVAQRIVEFVKTPHRHSSGSDHAGVITAEDFAGFEAGFEEAATIQFRGHTIAKTGPWGQGPVLLQALKILDGFGDEELDPATERGAHIILEALKLALADRDTYYGDTRVDLSTLLSDDYAKSRRALISDRASAEFRPGELPGVVPVLPPLREQPTTAGGPGVGEPTVSRAGEPTVNRDGEVRGDTCHIDVVDQWGNMVAATPSGGWLQSSPVIPGLGFCLGTRLQMNWLDPHSPSALRPGRRPRTTLTPTLILKDGHPVLALGSPGGDQQDQWQLLMVLRLIVGGYTLQEAIDAPALHTTSLPGSFWPRTWEPGGAVLESRLGKDVIEGLRQRGHRITEAGPWDLGRLSAVARDPRTGRLQAAANPRGAQGYAAGR